MMATCRRVKELSEEELCEHMCRMKRCVKCKSNLRNDKT